VAQETPWAEKLDISGDIKIRPTPEGRKRLRAGQPMPFAKAPTPKMVSCDPAFVLAQHARELGQPGTAKATQDV
jgi:hypothetical protein